MPHISHKKIKKNIFTRISKDFLNIAAGTKSKSDRESLLRELLTETEKIMLAKRLALALMIEKKYSFFYVEKTLKITPQTIARYYKDVKSGKFPTIKRLLADEKSRKEFWNSLEQTLRLGMPPMGRKRWKFLNKK